MKGPSTFRAFRTRTCLAVGTMIEQLDEEERKRKKRNCKIV